MVEGLPSARTSRKCSGRVSTIGMCRIEVLVERGHTPAPLRLATATLHDVIHDVLPGARHHLRVCAGEVNTSQREVEDGLIGGVVVGLGQLHRLGLVFRLERLPPTSFLVQQVVVSVFVFEFVTRELISHWAADGKKRAEREARASYSKCEQFSQTEHRRWRGMWCERAARAQGYKLRPPFTTIREANSEEARPQGKATAGLR